MHYLTVSNTGNNATIGIPVSINPTTDGNLLEMGDEIAVFADGRVMPDSFCVGVTKWTNSNTSITVWGDNEQTSAIDGIRTGTKFHFHIWKSSVNKEYKDAAVTYAQGDSLYRVNGVYILASLSAGTLHGYPTIIIESGISNMPKRFALGQNFPNPFNPSTTISYELSVRSYIRLEVFNTLGQKVALVVNCDNDAGVHCVQWYASVASGTYFYRIVAKSLDAPNIFFCDTKKLVLTR